MVIVLVIIIALYLMSKASHGTKKDLFFSIALLVLLLFNALKKYVLFPDQDEYEYMLKTLDYGRYRVNVGYNIFNELIHNIWCNYTFLSFIVVTFVIFSYAKVIRMYSPYRWMSLFLFIIVNYVLSFTLVRQYIAMAFVFLATTYVIERKLVPFILCVALGASFHTAAIIVLPLYFLYDVRNSVKNCMLLVVGAIVAIIVFKIVAFNVLNTYLTAYQNYTDNIYVNETGIATWPRAIMKIFIFCVFIFSFGRKSLESGMNKFIFLEMLLAIVICVGGIGMFGMFRLKEFFALSDIIGIPLIVKEMKFMPSTKRQIVGFCVLVYVGLLVVSFVRTYNTNFELGYQFIWQ